MARILLVDDDEDFRSSLAETLTDLGHEPVEAPDGAVGLARLRQGAFALVLLDLRMPGEEGLAVLARIRALPDPPPVAILTAVPDAANTIEAMRLGAFDHLAKPVGRRDVASLLARLPASASPRAPIAAPAADPATLVGNAPAMRDVHKAVGMLADSDTTVLLTGETGTGKEVVARAIHRHGRRGRRAFIAVNCAAIPAELLESELFGHVRGAFTGAVADRVGAFREADGGTLFLDEIGDMPTALQAKLLRVLQERVATPVGGRPVPIDVRVVAATHRALADEVAAGRFRADLFYRLAVVPVALPPLRERLADIVLLAELFLPADRSLTPDAAARLLAHPWPGNVRELRNAMERAAALSRAPAIGAADLAFLEVDAGLAAPVPSGTLEAEVEALERRMIAAALQASGGVRAEAARRLGIHRQLLHTKMVRYGMASGKETGGVRKDDEPG